MGNGKWKIRNWKWEIKNWKLENAKWFNLQKYIQALFFEYPSNSWGTILKRPRHC